MQQNKVMIDGKLQYIVIQNINNSQEIMKKKQGTKVKILILGESSVGKSSLLVQYVDQKFMATHMPTIGVDYKQKIIQLKDKSVFKVQIWDTAGTERFRTITPIYYNNVDGVFLVFDITDSESFQTINYWVEQLNQNADIGNIQLMLIGNKNDLESSREVKRVNAEQLASKLGIQYEQTSAKSYQSTQKAFSTLIDKILKRKKKQIQGGIKQNTVINEPKQKQKESCCN